MHALRLPDLRKACVELGATGIDIVHFLIVARYGGEKRMLADDADRRGSCPGHGPSKNGRKVTLLPLRRAGFQSTNTSD